VRVLTAIEFDGKTQSWSVKIQHVIAGWMLPTKINAKLAIAQFLPHAHLNIGAVASEIARPRSLQSRTLKPLRPFDPHPASFARRPPPFRGR
jgi:hypothetical protein